MASSKSSRLKRAAFMSYRIPLEGATERAHEKIRNTKEDKRFAGLVLLELVLILAMVASIAFFLDLEVAVTAAHALGIEADLLPVPWNFAVFAIIIVAILYIYSYTLEFRQQEFVQKTQM